MRRAWARASVACLAVSGCGRVRFDARADAPADTPAVMPAWLGDETTNTPDANTMSATSLVLTGGSLIVVAAVDYDNLGRITAVTDDHGDPFVAAAPAQVASTDNDCEVWYTADASDGTRTITATFTGGGGGEMWIAEFSGISHGDPVDSAGAVAGTEAAVLGSAAVTAHFAGDVVVATMVVAQGATGTIAAPFLEFAPINGDDAAYAIAAAPGSYQAIWQASGTGATCSSIVAFAPGP